MGIQTVEETGYEKSLIIMFLLTDQTPTENVHFGYYILNENPGLERQKLIKNIPGLICGDCLKLMSTGFSVPLYNIGIFVIFYKAAIFILCCKHTDRLLWPSVSTHQHSELTSQRPSS